MAITPDTKDWTWVLARPCPQCHFDARTFAARDVADMVRSNADAWPIILRRPDVAVRPDDHTWSPLEYGAHVRDVFRLFETRLHLMLDQDNPVFPNWDQDAEALADRYNEQDPLTVSREIKHAAEGLAALLDTIPGRGPATWRRRGRRGDGAEFTIDSFVKYLIHDVLHHLWDVR